MFDFFRGSTICSALLISMSLVAPALAEPGAGSAIPPRSGFWACMDQGANEIVTLQFGLLDGNRYTTYDGGRGRYTYSTQTGVLTFTNGPFAGLRRARDGELAFRIIDEHNKLTGNECPWTPKNPRKRHW